MKDESGQILPLTLVVVIMSLLMISPFLAGASTHLISEREDARQAREYYAADGGVEQALVALKRNDADGGQGTRDQALASFPNSYQLRTSSPDLNGLSALVSAKLLSPSQWETTELPSSRRLAGLDLGDFLRGGVAEAAPLFAADNTAWSFEDGTDGGWVKYISEGSGVNSVANTTAYAYAGTRSLDVNLNLQNASSTGGLAVNTTVVTGTITAWLMTTSNPVGIQARIFVYDTNNVAHYGNWSNPLTQTQWVAISYDISAAGWSPKTVGIGFKRGAGGRFSGEIYLDSVDYSRAGVSISKTVSPFTVTAGDPVTYTISLANTGAGAAYPSQITDTLATGFTYVAGSTVINGSGASDPSTSGQTLTWSSFSAVAAGGTLTLRFQANTLNSAETHYNSAGTTGTNYNAVSVANTAPVTTTLPMVGLGIDASTYTAYLGDQLSYTVSISNTGQGDARLTNLMVDLPAGFNYLPASSTWNGSALADPQLNGSRLTWSLSRSLAYGQSGTVSFGTSVESNAQTGSVGTTATQQGANFSDVQATLPQQITVVDPLSSAVISIDPTRGPPGFPITISGTGFRPIQDISIQWDGSTLATTPSSQGQFVVNTTVPANGTGAYWGAHAVTGVQGNVTSPPATFRVEAKYRVESLAGSTTVVALVGLHGPEVGATVADPTVTVYLWKQQ